MKKFKSKWFRVAVEGATTDKRTIERVWLEQAAKNFNQATYGARIWLEHFRGILSDSPFSALGDVVALKTEEVTIGNEKKLALFAQVDPTDELLAMNKKRQKLYTSCEFDPSFADTGEAYLVGLGVTDSPASLGTDMLTFAQQKPDVSPFRTRHYSEAAMYTAATETLIEFDEVKTEDKTLLTRVTELLTGAKKKDATDAQKFSDVHKAVEEIAQHAATQATAFTALQDACKAAEDQVQALTKRLDAVEAANKVFSEQLDNTELGGRRPSATGGDRTTAATDC
nr:GPO family capsid scaffolding protein [Perlucidibaca piscinae]